MQLVMINNSMHACILKNKTDDVSKDSPYFETSKCFVAQIIVLIEKLFSRKRFITMRSLELDLMLICPGDFFG